MTGLRITLLQGFHNFWPFPFFQHEIAIALLSLIPFGAHFIV